MNPGAKETAATLILGYAAPQRPGFQQEMFALLALFVAIIPLLDISTYLPTAIHGWPATVRFFGPMYPHWEQTMRWLRVAEPLAAILLCLAAIVCSVRRKSGIFLLLAIFLYLPVMTARTILEPLAWYRYYGGQWTRFLPAASQIVPVVLPLLLLLLLNPASTAAARFRWLRLHLLLLTGCVIGSLEMLHFFSTTRESWRGPVIDFWSFLELNPVGTLVCLGQLSLDIGAVFLILLLTQYFLTRRASATFIRAATSLLLLGWLFLTSAGILMRLVPGSFPLPSQYEFASYAEYGFLSLRFTNNDSTTRAEFFVMMTEYLAAAGIALLFILSLRIALNRPKLPWNYSHASPAAA